MKTLNVTDAKGAKESISDLETWGDSDIFKLLAKASSESEGWMKSTKAMQIEYGGCVVQVTTQQGDNIAEALVFIPNCEIDDIVLNGEVVARKLIRSSSSCR